MASIDWQAVLTSAIQALVVVLIPTIAAALTGLFSSWQKSLEIKATDAWWEVARKAVLSAVLATSQIYVDDLKASSRDGKLTEQEKAQALAHAIELAKKELGTVPELIRPKFEEWLRVEIEAALSKIKLAKASQQPIQLPTSGGVQTVAAAGSKSR